MKSCVNTPQHRPAPLCHLAKVEGVGSRAAVEAVDCAKVLVVANGYLAAGYVQDSTAFQLASAAITPYSVRRGVLCMRGGNYWMEVSVSQKPIFG